jgi:Lipocalin-like domain
MNRRYILNLFAITALGLGLLPDGTIAQTKSLKDQLVGTWTLTSIYNILPDGKRLDANGPSPKGLLILEPSGRFAQIIIDSTIPKFASNNRQQGTPEDFKRVAQGSIATFGTFTVNADETISQHFEYSSFPNVNGTDGTREVKIAGDEMQFINRGAPSGGVAYSAWSRAK